jgi:hypothetical protein
VCVWIRVSVSDLVSLCSCLLRSVCDGKVRSDNICCICLRSGRLRATNQIDYSERSGCPGPLLVHKFSGFDRIVRFRIVRFRYVILLQCAV